MDVKKRMSLVEKVWQGAGAFKLYTGLDMPAQELKAFLAKREEEGVEPLADVAENVPF